MKKLLKSVTAFIMALAMLSLPVTPAAAQSRGRNSHFSNQDSPSQSQNRRPASPSHNNRPGNQGNNRPGNRPNNPGNRPGNNRPDHNRLGNNRPGNNRPDHNRPGNNRPDHNRPGNNRPGNHRPGYDRPGYNRPGHHRPAPPRPRPSARPPHLRPGYRHPVPFFNSWHRPLPPRAWRPAPRYIGPSFGTILGVALGTTMAVTVNSLLNQGYTVTGYGDNVVYLNNVPQMNYYWPDAAMYYNNGMLCGSTFTYPQTYYDMSRYNSLYNTFCSQYGMPVSTVNSGGVVSATWFGNGNRFVTLEFNSNYGGYYTTLRFGN